MFVVVFSSTKQDNLFVCVTTSSGLAPTDSRIPIPSRGTTTHRLDHSKLKPFNHQSGWCNHNVFVADPDCLSAALQAEF
jgi:hypothetical protein